MIIERKRFENNTNDDFNIVSSIAQDIAFNSILSNEKLFDNVRDYEDSTRFYKETFIPGIREKGLTYYTERVLSKGYKGYPRVDEYIFIEKNGKKINAFSRYFLLKKLIKVHSLKCEWERNTI